MVPTTKTRQTLRLLGVWPKNEGEVGRDCSKPKETEEQWRQRMWEEEGLLFTDSFLAKVRSGELLRRRYS
jgi:hypothetical protein